MKILISSLSVAALALTLVAGPASAKGLCKLTGNYSDLYGSTTSIKGRKGSILNTILCATPYTFVISNETTTGFTVTGKNKTKSCGTFTAMPQFEGSCAVFGGTVTVNGNMLTDTFTLITGAKHEAPASSALTKGMH